MLGKAIIHRLALLCNIALYEYTTIHLSILLNDIWIISVWSCYYWWCYDEPWSCLLVHMYIYFGWELVWVFGGGHGVPNHSITSGILIRLKDSSYLWIRFSTAKDTEPKLCMGFWWWIISVYVPLKYLYFIFIDRRCLLIIFLQPIPEIIHCVLASIVFLNTSANSLIVDIVKVTAFSPSLKEAWGPLRISAHLWSSPLVPCYVYCLLLFFHFTWGLLSFKTKTS